MLAFGLCQAVSAQGPRLEAEVDHTQVTIGETFHYRVSLIYGGGQIDNTPSQPDFGGLIVRSGPSISQRVHTVNRTTRVVSSYIWTLSAPQEGSYTIGPSRLETGGQVLQSSPITITATQPQLDTLPADLRDEPILFAQANDRELTDALKGRLFLRPSISTTTPYVRQPVIIRYDLFKDPQVPLAQYSENLAEIEGPLVEQIFHAPSISFSRLNVGERVYEIAPRLTLAVTPTKPGELVFEGYSMTGGLRIRRNRSSRGLFDAPFSILGDPYETVAIPTMPIRLNVRALPTAGEPEGFTGTVGDFALEASVDRTEATTDDLITLTLALSGRGAIELANAPALPSELPFEIAGESQNVERANQPDQLGGVKRFEYVLRPTRTGRLTIPALRYPIFDPYSESYRVLKTEPLNLLVQPGAAPLPAGAEEAGEDEEQAAATIDQLNYIQGLSRIEMRRQRPLLESPWLWALHLLGVGLLAGGWRYDRYRSRLDPARIRRSRAWVEFERRTHAVDRKIAHGAPPAEAAAELEQAARSCIADRFNLSPDGLTRREIQRHLHSAATLPSDRIERLCDLLDECAALRYAPAGAVSANLADCRRELGELLKEALGR